VLDEQYLIERATQGLYWFVHEHERDLDDERGWKRWNGAYASMVERRAEDQLRRLAPPLIGGGSTFFSEEDLQAAFPRSKNSDAGIDFGELTLLAEVVTGQAALATRENADAAAYAGDIEKLFVKKARQLDETAASLLRDPQPAASPLDKPARRILPVTVRGWQFPLNPLTRGHIEDALRSEGLLNYRRPAVPVAGIAPVENRIRAVTCDSSGCQAARAYSLIRPPRTGFRTIRAQSRSATVRRPTACSPSGTRWAMPWCGRAVL
jgi:hypothetical protein